MAKWDGEWSGRSEAHAYEAGYIEACQRAKRAQETIDLAWGLIANAGGGDWSKETPKWRQAAIAWRDERYSPETAIESALDRAALAADPEKEEGERG